MEFDGMQMEMTGLPPGFRFHPTDEELITHYLANKAMNPRFTARAIGDVDLNKCEPWDIPSRANMGEKECYFFCLNGRKYPTGLRMNRATASGYWKATGKDKDIYRGKSLVGMKKTLVFYLGRAPKGVKTDWVMHEFRLEGNCSAYNLSKDAKKEWVISKVFSKSSGVKKVLDCDELGVSSSTHVTCFSNIATQGRRGGPEELLLDYYNNPLLSAAPAENFSGATMSLPSTMYRNIQYPVGSFVRLLESNGCAMNQREKTEKELVSVSQETGITIDANPEISSVVSNNEMAKFSFDGQGDPCSSAGYLWNY